MIFAAKSGADPRLLAAGVQVDLATLVQQSKPAKTLWPLLAEGLLGPLLGQRTAQGKGAGLNFAELNHYQPGDDVRHIDWKLSRRQQRPYVRHYHEEKEQRFELLVDQSASMLFGSSVDSKAVAAAKLAAQIGWQAVQQGDPCACAVVTQQGLQWGQSRRGLTPWLLALDQLRQANQALQVSAAAPAGWLSDCLEHWLDRRYRGRHIYIISDFNVLQNEAERDRFAQRVMALAQHNSVRLLQIFDQLEYRIPAVGRLPISDGQRHAQFDSASEVQQQILAQHLQQRGQYLRQLAQALPHLHWLALDCALLHCPEIGEPAEVKHVADG